ncbi:MAG: RnfABCDGE type electron transport complex subunit B [Peptostreptococcales bacterium]
MDLSYIIIPVISLGGMALIFGAILAVASEKFKVEVDQRIIDIRAVLPGANCGGCGFPGCDGYANAVVSGAAKSNGCPVCSSEIAAQIAAIMGDIVETCEKQIAHVICKGGCDNSQADFEYFGIKSCKAANRIKGGSKSCKAGCLGLGTCVLVCPFDAIKIDENRLAVVDPEKCTGCKQCVEECPKHVIEMIPASQQVIINCNNKEPGKIVRQICSVGCIGCKICVKACPHEAIGFENNLAKIDYEKCTNCGVCVQKCPTKIIWGPPEIIDEVG